MVARKTDPHLDNFRYWARHQFAAYRACIAFVESCDENGDIGVGTCFHVGEGVFLTARHVMENRQNFKIGFDDDSVTMELLQSSEYHGKLCPGELEIVDGPYYHPDAGVDVACFRADHVPKDFIPLGGHLEDFLGQYDLLLHRVLVLGHPPIPHADRPVLVASLGEINALATLYDRKYPHFLVSVMARGGFSGGPVLVAYDELNEKSGTAVLGLIPESLVRNSGQPETGYMAVLTVDPIYECLETHGMLPKAQALDITD